MIVLSYLLVVIEPISALFLALLVMHHRLSENLNFTVRFYLACLAVGLVVHAAGQVELIADYREPRTLSWIPLIFSINGTIWAIYVSCRVRLWYETKRAATT